VRCKTCGYHLWNLTSRTCPECGSPFRPSQFEFLPNAVRYCCPHCQQAYYGTDASGHLVPRAFDCVSCGHHIDMDETILLPAEGVDEDGTGVSAQPWLEPADRGFFRRWFDTTIMAMVRPTDLARATPDQAPLTTAWGYALLNLGVVAFVSLAFVLTCVGLSVGVAARSSPGGFGTGGAGLAPLLVAQAGAQAVYLAATVVFVLIWIGCTHGLLRLTGAHAGTIRTTTHAILFASGTHVLSIIPCVGSLSGIWWIVSAILMIMAGHKISGWRATLVTLATPVVSFLLAAGAYTAIILFAMNGSMASTSSTWSTSSTASLERVGQAVLARAGREGGWDHTDHALLLIADGDLEPSDLVADDTATFAESVQIGRAKLSDLGKMSDSELVHAIGAPIDLPPGVVAHRVGDDVFVYHGIDAANPPPGLWIVIEHELGSSGPPTAAFTTDGTIVVFASGVHYQTLLRAQNRLRAAHGLPPLPIASRVGQDAPVIIPDADASP